MYKEKLIKKVLLKNELQAINKDDYGIVGKLSIDQNGKECNPKRVAVSNRAANLSGGIFQRQ